MALSRPTPRPLTLLPAALCVALSASPLRAEPPAPSPAPLVVEGPALTTEDLQRLEARMKSADAAERLRAATAVAGAGADGYEAYAAYLQRPVMGRTEVIRALIHGIWGQYPNPDYPKGPGKDPPMWYVRPEPKWVPPPRVPGQPRPQRPPKHDAEAVDWLTALAELDLAKEELTRDLDPKEAAEVRAEVLMRVALLRAIAAAGTRGERDAVYPLFAFAFVRDGLFRDECGRAVRSMGSYAVPALVRIYNNRQKGSAKMRRYASYQLDRMDRLRPTKAISTAPDDLTRAEIIRAYGEARALDAVEAVLGQLDATSHRVRREARWAWLRYVDGPPPPPSPKRKRKLPGGGEEREEKEDYLNYREMARLVLQRKLKEMTGQEPAPSLTARQMTDQLLAIYDGRREVEFSQLMEGARAKERAGDLAGAVDAYGWILAHQPDHPRRADMAPAFSLLGQRIAAEGEEQGDEGRISRAVGLLRQALALDPALPEARRVTALVHYLDGRQAQARGGDGIEDLERAVAADPGFLRARKALEAARLRHPRASLGWLSGTLALGLLLPVAYLLWRRGGRRAEDLGHPDGTTGAAASGPM